MATTQDALTSSLNPEQLQAVTTTHSGPTLVLAGAGCGKTAVLTRRIAFLARGGESQDRILALTFTRKAANEMAHRVRGLSGIDGAAPMPLITTFHGFGLRVLRDSVLGISNARRLGYGTEPRLLEHHDRLKALARITTTEERVSMGVDLTRLDALLEQRSVNPVKPIRLPQDQVGLLIDIESRLAKEKTRLGVWEFSDMLDGVVDIFEHHPEVAAHYAARFRHVLVDEFQDTNPIQILMLRFLLLKGATLCAVGDDDQAIYGFRGADIEPIRGFIERFPGAQILKLQTNYRSTPAILNTANRIFRDKPEDYRKVLRSGRYTDGTHGAYPRKLGFRDQPAMCRWICSTLSTLERVHSIRPDQAALLFRTNQSLDQAKSYILGRADASAKAPQFLTVHGSKGLEFPVVFLCDLEEGSFPHYRGRSDGDIRSWGDALRLVLRGARSEPPDCDIEEERRLFYVGVTRAERHLYMLRVRQKEQFGRLRPVQPSRFLWLV